MNDRWCFLHLWILMSVLMTARCRPTLKGMDHKTKKHLRPIKTVIPKPFHERSKKHDIFTLAAPPTTASLLPAVNNMVLMPNSVPAALQGEPVQHMLHQHPLDIPYSIPGPLHRGVMYRGLHQPIPWHYYAGLYHHGFPDPYRYHGPALYPVGFPAGFPSYVLDHNLRYNQANTVFLGARSTLSHRSVPAFVNYPKPFVHYPHPHYVQLNGNGRVVLAPRVHVYS